MTKTELIKIIADKTEVSQKTVGAVIDTFMDEVMESVAKGDAVRLVGFGNFEVSERGERTGRNPQTGEELTLPACKAPKFKASKKFKEFINA